MSKIKRFYRDVSLETSGDFFAVSLDGRVAKTTGRQILRADRALAEALAAEWRGQGDEVDLISMPLTRIHGFVLDAGATGQAEFTATILQYAASDLLCYRASEPDLAARQRELFDPFLELAAADGFRFVVTEGIVPVDQPQTTLDALAQSLETRPTSEIFPRKLLTKILGSAVLGIYADQNPEAAFAAARLDETAQAEKWGVDHEAEAREKRLREDFETVLRYLSLQST